MSRERVLLIVVILLAIVLRFWHLGSYPALNADEAAIGYNAYSLLETGKDEHGNSWPVHFQSFNDYKPGLYFYMVMPFVRLMGLSEWAVRLPGASLGVGTVLAVYVLAKELFEDERQALMAALFMAISPWAIHFSRGGWEVNAATFLILLGALFWLKGRKRAAYYYVAALALVASLYTYHAARVVVPLLVGGWAVMGWGWREMWRSARILVLAAVMGVVLLLPLAWDLAGPGVMSRAAGVGLFADTGPLARINEQRGEHADYRTLVPRTLHNKVVNYGLALVGNWGEHYWGEFLFLSGDEIQRNRVPETGQMYMADFMFVVVGLVMIARRPKKWRFVLWWLLVAPVGAALTFQSPHALRAHNMIVPLVIISAYGCVTIIDMLEEMRWGWLGYILMGLLIGWGLVRYQRMYWLHMAKEYPYSSQYGVKELVEFLSREEGKYEKVIVTDRYDQPYVLFLFYMKYPPGRFQVGHQLTERDSYGFSTVRNFDKYNFSEINYDSVQPENPRSLIVGTDEEIPDEANVIGEIYGMNGRKYFQVVAN